MMPENELYPPTKSRTVRNEQQRSEKVLQEFVKQNRRLRQRSTAAVNCKGRMLSQKTSVPGRWASRL